MNTFHPSILKTYDIRGIYQETLHDEDAYRWGYLFTQYLKLEKPKSPPKIAVGYDTRKSSPNLKKAMIEGIVDAGGYAIDIGMGPTPYLYNATKTLRTQGGIMITGSHNPSNYNGFKTLTSSGPVSGELIQKIASMPLSEKGDPGKSKKDEFYGRYLLEVMMNASLMPFSGMPIVWDCGNGAMGIIIDLFAEVYGGPDHIALFTEPNGDFPNHHPDPSKSENYTALLRKMQEVSARVGFMFDGDGDRMGIVLDGKILLPDQIIAVLALDYLYHFAEQFGNKIIVDVKASASLVDILESSGAEVVFSPCGHSLIKEKMKKQKIGFAGETSGHIFYKHNHNFDDGLLAAFTFLRLLINSPTLIEHVLKKWKKNHLSPEIRIPFDDQTKDTLFKNLEKEISKLNMTVLKIDGIRALNDDGWFLIRASNTEPQLSMRVEGHTQETYEKLCRTLETVLSNSGNPIDILSILTKKDPL